MKIREATMLTLCMVCLAQGLCADTVGWRGDGSGRYAGVSPVLEWGKEKNILWETETEEWSNALAVPVGDRIFICSERANLLCVSASDGSILWRKSNDYDALLDSEDAARLEEGRTLQKQAVDLAEQIKRAPWDLSVYNRVAEFCGKVSGTPEIKKSFGLVKTYQDPQKHVVTGYSTPTPVSDGEHVFVLTGLGTLACYTLDGERVWIRKAATPKHVRGHSASPLLVEGLLIVHVSDAIAAFDTQTGEPVWTERGSSVFGTPAVVRAGGGAAVFTTGGDLFRVKDGKKLASGCASMPWTSPIAEGDTIYVVDDNAACALRVPELTDDEVEVEKLWEMKPPKDRYYASPLLHDGLLYAVNQAGALSVIDAADGSLVYTEKLGLGNTIYPSLCLAGERIFVSSDNGKTVVLVPGREYKEAARNELGPFRSTPVFAGDRMIVRGLKALYCVGK